MTGMMLVVRMADEIVALAADAIESVVEIDAINPVPLAPPHIAGLAALRSRVLTVIDSRAALGCVRAAAADACSAVIVPVNGHPYGIVVDEVLDVATPDAEPEPLRAPVDGIWSAVASATVTIDGRLRLLVDPVRLIAGPSLVAA